MKTKENEIKTDLSNLNMTIKEVHTGVSSKGTSMFAIVTVPTDDVNKWLQLKWPERIYARLFKLSN